MPLRPNGLKLPVYELSAILPFWCLLIEFVGQGYSFVWGSSDVPTASETYRFLKRRSSRDALHIHLPMRRAPSLIRSHKVKQLVSGKPNAGQKFGFEKGQDYCFPARKKHFPPSVSSRRTGLQLHTECPFLRVKRGAFAAAANDRFPPFLAIGDHRCDPYLPPDPLSEGDGRQAVKFMVGMALLMLYEPISLPQQNEATVQMSSR